MVGTIVRWAVIPSLLVQVSASAGPESAGQPGESDGIVVRARGETRVMPDTVVMHVRVNGAAELSSDAIIKYREARRRVLEALNRLELKNLKCDLQGLNVSTQPAIGHAGVVDDAAATPRKHQIAYWSRLRVAWSGVAAAQEDAVMETIARIIDAARDAGAEPEPNAVIEDYNDEPLFPTAQFVVADASKARETAYALAITRAQAQADRLARLANLQIGPIRSVEELDEESDASSVVDYMPNGSVSVRVDDAEELRLSSQSLHPIRIRVQVQVRFAIAPAATSAGGRTNSHP